MLSERLIELLNLNSKIMKHILIFLSLVFCVISCQNDEVTEQNINLLKIDQILEYLPINSLNGKSKALYTSINGEEIILSFEINEEIKSKKNGETTYNAEDITITYTDPSTDEYSIYIKGSANYLEEGFSNQFVSVGLTQFKTGYSPLITISDSGLPIFGSISDSMEIGGKNFQNVYMNLPIENINSYDEIYYSSILGVVGFTDENGEVYSLKEIRE